MQQSFLMNGGDGPHSYRNNSHFQRQDINVSRTMIEEAIAKKLDVMCFSSNPFRLADLGCSVGPNTFIAMQHIVEAVERKYLAQGLKSEMPEFQVFFNDHVGNDFNTLFASLPTERRYFACGVPGSFHGRLFPESSIHFMFSSHALHWLSKVPEELLDKNSPAWNRGRIHYTSGPEEVSHAYAAQFERDMEIFLSARAKELVVGGMIVFLIPALPNGIPASQNPYCVMFDLLGASLMDMAKEGLISEAQVDSFNLPIHVASPEQMTEMVDRNECLTIERMELVDSRSKLVGPINGKECAMCLRAGLEGIFTQHFGSGIIDQLFDRLSKQIMESSHQLESGNKEGTLLFVVLRRK
ncbi:loganic acid O-methyltransferase [Vitis vinifera]|uniref:S-adenosylmethionine-dependent methyltransferase n=1 Tax=Vitis vinifera TaxID=29760 RepID=F6HFC6_VITVI|nr:loganic acid O-methyltransferase [Vitis vinifera]|eukprot:XP_002281378.1 PREDICTED: probable S-adenosylmethionine-dependent methyltransferase At5g37990 [Vitis vinifera]